MQTLLVLVASLGILAALVYCFSWWTAFGTVYMLSMLLVAVVAFSKRSGHQSN